MGSAGLRPGSGETGAAERLRSDHRADDAAIDIDIADHKALDDVLYRGIDARLDAERETVSGCRNVGEELVKRVGPITHHMQHGSEYLLPEVARAVELDDGRGHIGAASRYGVTRPRAEPQAALRLHAADPAVEIALCLGIDHGADMGRGIARIAELE